MYIRVKIGRYAGEIKWFRNDVARQMVQDGRAAFPDVPEIETMSLDTTETATKKRRRRRRKA